MMIGETTVDMLIGETITDQMIGETIIDRTITEINQLMEGTINNDIGIEVKVGTILEIFMETIQEKDLSEVEIEVEIEKYDQE